MREAWQDTEREEGTLTRVERHKDGSTSVTSDNRWTIGVDAKYGVQPKVGDAFVTWGSIGRPVRGMALNGAVLYYRTPEEQLVEDQLQVDRHKAERIAEYESKRSDFDARVAALPAPLRERIEGFRAFKGEAWRWEFEPYEMACCEEAARIAERFNTAEKVKAFAALKYEQQKKAHPTMDDGHSGNTWGKALRLAVLLCDHPELVPKDHAGICALVGCEDAGCWSSRPESGVAA